MDGIALDSAIAVVALMAAHLFVGGLRFLGGIPRSRLLSLAGGVSVAYVIVHLLPELEEAQEAVEGSVSELPFLERHAYLLALFGLALFYGVERLTRPPRASAGPAFWFSIGSFAVYNAIIGYLLVHREDETATGLALFALAMGVHFVVNDFGLRERHREAYVRVGRWALAGALLAGWAVGLAWEFSEAAIGVLVAFIAGGVILNVMKEELPEERQSRFSAFALGAAAYAALLLAI